jgi:hypothetical protein
VEEEATISSVCHTQERIRTGRFCVSKTGAPYVESMKHGRFDIFGKFSTFEFPTNFASASNNSFDFVFVSDFRVLLLFFMCVCLFL